MQQIKDIHHFVGARMNTDSADIALKENEYRLIKNSLVSAPGYVGKLKKMPGFKNVMTLPINSDFTMPSNMVVVGSCEDLKNNAIVYAVCHITGGNAPIQYGVDDGIFRIFTYNNKLEWISQNDPIWNFQQHKKVSMFTVEDLLYLTDGYEGTPFVDYNPPRKINMVKCCAYTNPYSTSKPYYKGMVVGDSGHSYRCTVNGSSNNFSDFELANIGIYANNVPYLSTPYSAIEPYYYGNIVSSGGHFYRYINNTPPTFGQPVTNPTYWTPVPATPAITLQVVDRIKYPLASDLIATYITDITVKTNSLRGHLFKFKAIYVYDDKEKSVYSCDSDIPLPQLDELVNGNFSEDVTVNNAIQISLNTGSLEVVRIDVAVSEGGSETFANWKIIKSIEKYQANGDPIFPSNSTYLLNFYNNVDGYAVSPADVNRWDDAVPQISAHETMMERNRILDADYTSGFNNTPIDVTITPTKYFLPSINLGSTVNGIDYPTLPYPGVYADIPTCAVGTMLTLYVNRLTLASGNSPPAYGDTAGSELLWASAIWQAGDTPTTMCVKLRDSVNSTMASMYTYPPTIPIQYMAIPANQEDGSFPAYRLYLVRDTILTFNPADSTTERYYVQLLTLKTIVPTPKITCFKSGSLHLFGIEYFDRAMRRTFVNISDNSRVYIPYVTENLLSPTFLNYYYNINFQINSQPPEWAVYYRLVYLPGIDFFLDFAIPMSEIYNDQMNTYVLLNDTITRMSKRSPQFSIDNYEWKQGDRIRFVNAQQVSSTVSYADSRYISFPSLMDYEILGTTLAEYNSATQNSNDWYVRDKSVTLSGAGEFKKDADGNKVEDIGKQKLVIPLINQKINVWPKSQDSYVGIEIYRPKRNTAGAIVEYNEIDAIRPILYPHTANRAHSGSYQNQVVGGGSVIQNAINILTRGDSYLRVRLELPTSLINGGQFRVGTNFWCEAREFSDYYKSDYLNIGRPNFTNPDAERKEFISKYLWSGAFVQDTNINDLSRVNASDSGTLAEKFGHINHIEEVGYTLKVLQTKKSTSVKINRITFSDLAGGKDSVGKSQEVLGTPEPHDSDYGTTHSTGVVKHENRMYFPDLYAGLILMDSQNGIHPISSEYGVDNLIKTKFKKFLDDGIDNISIYSAYDELYNLAYFSFVDSVTPSENFTIAFRESPITTEQGFILFDFIPNFYGTTKNMVTSWDAALWVHNDPGSPLMNFYGVQYYPSFTYLANKQGGVIKDHKAIVLTATEEWFAPNAGDLKIISNGTYREKQTKIPKGKFGAREGKYYSEIPRNMLTKSNTPSMVDFLSGDQMRGEVMEITLTNDTVNDSEVTAVEINSIYSIGS